MGADPSWRENAHTHPTRVAPPANPADPNVQVRRAALDAVALTPDGIALDHSPARLQSWCRSRLAEAHRLQQPLTLHDLLREAVTVGDYELRFMAEQLAHDKKLDCPKTGVERVQISTTDWSGGGLPGKATLVHNNMVYNVYDYGDALADTPALRRQLGSHAPKDGFEVRQCLNKVAAACALRARHGRAPAHTDVVDLAQVVRYDQYCDALACQCALGEPPAWVLPAESDLRVMAHDALHADHEKDYRSWAAFPAPCLAMCTVFIWRVNSGLELTVFALVGARSHETPASKRYADALIYKGHMRLLMAPDNFDRQRWFRGLTASGRPPVEINCHGWEAMLLQEDDDTESAPGDPTARCHRCKLTARAATEAKVADRVGELPVDRPRSPEPPLQPLVEAWRRPAWQPFASKAQPTAMGGWALHGREVRVCELWAGVCRFSMQFH